MLRRNTGCFAALVLIVVSVGTISSCRLLLGPEIDLQVDVTLQSATLVGDSASEEYFSYTVTVEAHGQEHDIVPGQTISLPCTTWQWVKFSMRVVDESKLIDRTSGYQSSLLGGNILEQSPYVIVREVEVGDSEDGDVLWRFQFGVAAAEL